MPGLQVGAALSYRISPSIDRYILQIGRRRCKMNASKEKNASAEISEAELAAFQNHQSKVPKLPLAVLARTMVDKGNFGVLSTISRGDLIGGYPSGSVVEYAADNDGNLIMSLSSLSAHTGDMLEDARCSVTIMENGFKGMKDARITLVGKISPVGEDTVAKARETYVTRHPDSFWVDFGDFTWFKMDTIRTVRVVGGFGRAGSVSEEAYRNAKPDPLNQFSGPVCGHMNQDHSDSTVAMVRHYVGLSVDEAMMMSLDSLGIDISCKKNGEVFMCRLPFPEPIQDRKSIKDAIVQMTREAASAASSEN